MEKYKLVDGKITQTVSVEIKPFDLKNKLNGLRQREAFNLKNLTEIQAEIAVLEAQIDVIKVDTGVEISTTDNAI